MKLEKVIANKKVVWRVLNNHFNFVEDKSDGSVQESFLKSPKRMEKLNYILSMRDWCLNTNVTRFATMRGPVIFRVV